jgi:salicylate hydroxylase
MDTVKNSILIVGGGIGGLAAALACAQRGAQAHVIERAHAFSEVGAGIQMGPNVTRTLFSWGLEKALREVVFTPERLQVRDVQTGRSLGVLRLGQRSLSTYGAPYFTVHRADLHQVLLQQVLNEGTARLSLQGEVDLIREEVDHLTVQGRGLSTALLETLQTEALVGADGLWSTTRQHVTDHASPRVTGLLAYRALVPMHSLPESLRTQDVMVWVGPKVHAVLYPVKRGEYLNLVVIVRGQAPESLETWDHAANKQELNNAMGFAHADLKNVLEAVEAWRLWPLCDRPPVRGPQDMAKGRIALLGDAAHPMRPFLAQGAGMAIEDADTLAACWAMSELPIEDRWRLYAQKRWARNAKVQQRSIRNGEIFHSEGMLRWGRDLAMKALGEAVMDVPWLYAGP